MPSEFHMVALWADKPMSDNVTVSAIIRFCNLKFGVWVKIVAFSKINMRPALCIFFAFIVIKPLSDSSRSHIVSSINCRCLGVMF